MITKNVTRTVAAIALVLCGVHAAIAQNNTPLASMGTLSIFKSSKGFSISYPSDWTLASKDQTRDVTDKVKSIEKLPDFDLDRVAVLILDPKGVTFHRNLNVVVTSGRLSITEEHEADLRNIVNQSTAAFGSQPNNLRISIETFAGNEAMVARYNWTMNGIPLTQMQVIMSGRSHSYAITCTGETSNASADEQVFNVMINSMKIEDGFGSPPGISSGVVTGAVVGAIIGLFIGLIRKRKRS